MQYLEGRQLADVNAENCQKKEESIGSDGKSGCPKSDEVEGQVVKKEVSRTQDRTAGSI